MYKIKQVAEMLNIETVVIHEKLILFRELLEPHVIRKNGVIYIKHDGVQFIAQSIETDPNEEDANQLLSDDQVETFDEHKSLDMQHLKERMNTLKREINKTDLSLKRQEDAISHYQQMINEDLERLKAIEAAYFLNA